MALLYMNYIHVLLFMNFYYSNQLLTFKSCPWWLWLWYRTTMIKSLIDHSTKGNNSHVSKPVLLLKVYNNLYIYIYTHTHIYIPVIKEQNLCHLQQHKIVTDVKFDWYALHIVHSEWCGIPQTTDMLWGTWCIVNGVTMPNTKDVRWGT